MKSAIPRKANKPPLKTAQNKTFRFEARTPNGKWCVCGRNVSAVEADAYAKKYQADPDFRVVPEADWEQNARRLGRDCDG